MRVGKRRVGVAQCFGGSTPQANVPAEPTRTPDSCHQAHIKAGMNERFDVLDASWPWMRGAA